MFGHSCFHETELEVPADPDLAEVEHHCAALGDTVVDDAKGEEESLVQNPYTYLTTSESHQG